MAVGRLQIPEETVAELRRICLALPETRQEQAWVGTRWRVRTHTFAHLLMIDGGSPPAYARAAGTEGPACILTFRAWDREFAPPELAHPPFFWPGWWPDIVGMVMGAAVDWEQVGELIAMSYRVMAPKKLADMVTED